MNTAAEVIAGTAPWSVIQGDCVAGMRTLPDGCVHCCVTSPPYYGLRDYGTATWEGGDPECDHQRPPLGGSGESSVVSSDANGAKKAACRTQQYRETCGRCGAVRIDQQIGLEDTPENYVAKLVGVFREVRRIMRPDATLWLNIADSYASGGGTPRPGEGKVAGRGANRNGVTVPVGCKPKDLIGIPWMLAFALRADGWYLRSEIIWAKPSPMPSSVRDRPTTAHEQMFLLAKQPRYFYDAQAIAEKAKTAGKPIKTAAGWDTSVGAVQAPTANKRSVWRIASRSYKGAHFATYPPKLVEPCVLAGTSAKGVCPACGAPWAREVKKDRRATRPGDGSKVYPPVGGYVTPPGQTPNTRSRKASQEVGNRDPERHVTTTETVGWKPSCGCDAGEAIGAIVFDPFAGSGTTLAVAVNHGRRGLGTELNADYLTLIEARMRTITPTLFSEAT